MLFRSEEIIENEFYVNLPRYIDTVEPEEQIPIPKALSDLQTAINVERKAESTLNEYLAKLTDGK